MEEKLKSLLKYCHSYDQDILEGSRVEEISRFYFACKNGDTDIVKQMLPTIPYDQLNQLEPNGSTALHAATYCGHLDIVRLLLHEYGCQRHLRNLYGFTAYEIAQTEEMRQVFHRPSNKNRFNDDSMGFEQTFRRHSSSINQIVMGSRIDDNDVAKPNQRFYVGYETNEEVKKQLDSINGVKALFQSRIGRYITKQGIKLKLGKRAGYSKKEYPYIANEQFQQESLQKILDESVTSNHIDYKHCCYLLNEYIQQGTIESLLKLYTLETPFYWSLFKSPSPLEFPLFMHLSDLKERYYQGYSYRGVQLTQHQLDEYRWALKTKDSVLSLVTFASTSINRSVAEQFAVKSSSSDKITALLIFHFPQPCDTAINLSKIPQYQLPCISNYENEKEILIAPRTFFKVTDIEIDQPPERYTIYLENFIIKILHDLAQIGSIYVLQDEHNVYVLWPFEQYGKVNGPFSVVAKFYDQMKTDMLRIKRERECISFVIWRVSDNTDSLNTVFQRKDRQEAAFMFGQLLKRVLVDTYNKDDDSIESFSNMMHCLRQLFANDKSKLNFLQEFESEYKTHTPIYWYSLDSFLYELVNKALREQNTELLFHIRIFIRGLHQQIVVIYNSRTTTECTTVLPMVLYRGALIPINELNDRILNNPEGLLSISSSLSTSANK
ncbi:unnamed protein product [Rotaria sp. Silwood1]|nr:unnamed protein product [Rotaria sp. Silwood1]